MHGDDDATGGSATREASLEIGRVLALLARFEGEAAPGRPPAEIRTGLQAVRTHAIAARCEPLAEVAGIAVQLLDDIGEAGGAGDADPMSHLVGVCHGMRDCLQARDAGDVDADALLAELLAAARDLRGSVGPSSSPRPGHAGPSRDAGPDPLDVVPSADVPAELSEIFAAEARDHLQTIAGALRACRVEPAVNRLRDVRRSVHTLKGAAGLVGFRAVSQLSHRMEDLLDELFERDLVPSAAVLDLLYRSSDLLEDLVARAATPDALAARLGSVLRDHVTAIDGVADHVPASPAASQDGSTAGTENPPRPPAVAAPPAPEPEHGAAGRPRSGQPPPAAMVPGGPAAAERFLRVPRERLDDLAREVGELSVGRSMVDEHVSGIARDLAELQLSVRRLRRLASRLESEFEALALGDGLRRRAGGRVRPAHADPAHEEEFDDLELDRYTDFHLISRELAETASDVGALGRHLDDLTGELDGAVKRLGRLTRDVQADVTALRLVRIGRLATRLERTVRVTAAQRGKLVALVIEGDHHAVDASVLDQLGEPLLHLLRNAVDHGIEPPAVRRAAGKPETGRITVRAARDGDHLVLEVADDGAGIDDERLRARAVERGVLTPAHAASATGEALRALIFVAGFSTSDSVDEVSGRGVGLDIVKARIEQLTGSVSVSSVAGQGTAFRMRLPATLAVTRVLLVRAGERRFAVPAALVKDVRRAGREVAASGPTPRTVALDGRVLPLVWLAEGLGLAGPCASPSSGRPTLLDVDVPEGRVVLAVDEAIEAREVIVRPLGAHVRRVPCVSGATVLGDGSVVLALDVADVIRRAGDASYEDASATPRPRPRSITVLVVDDSLTVRRVLSNLVSGAGWTPLQARDGVEALEVLQRLPAPPDLILVDIEMPRLDGFELTATLRAQAPFRDVPIVMITSRGADKHRQKADAAGVTDYVVKPFDEAALMARLADLARSRPGAAA